MAFVNELDAQRRGDFLRQISQIDFAEIARFHASFGEPRLWDELAKRAEPPSAFRLNDDSASRISPAAAIEGGEAALAAGTVALVLVAGGQGTRLGFESPKGMLPVGPVSQRTLFQIHIDKLIALNARFGKTIPVCIMTSPTTHAETEAFLSEHNWFGYPRSERAIFCQGTMPAVDAKTGKVLLADKGELFLSPDGHGGMLAAFHGSGCLSDLADRGIKYIFYGQVDNPLSQLCDAAMLGYHILAQSEMSSQAIPKTGPLQKVGNLVCIDGKIHVIEYSDLPEEVARATNEDGSLRLWAGSIAVHVFDIDFLIRVTGQANALPFHVAHKKVPHIDGQGRLVEPAVANAVKFERFIFDLLPLAKHSIVVEVDPSDAFSPVKNAPSESSSTVWTAQQAMIQQARRALKAINADVPDSIAIEIAPALLADSRLLSQRVSGSLPITKPVFLK